MEEDRNGVIGSRPANKLFSHGNIQCLVTQRDNVCYSFKFKDDVKGEDVMDEVCNKLGIIEKDYFGMQYTNPKGEIRWLNMRNRLTRQLAKPEPYSLMFCVKFYVEPHQLIQASTRHQFFLNIKEDLSAGKYYASSAVMARLYALLSQAEAGDFRENHISYNPSRWSHWSPKFRSQVITEHCKLVQMSTNEAEYYLLKEVAELEDYGMEYHPVKVDFINKPVVLGIGIDCLKFNRGNDVVDRVPYTCFKQANQNNKAVMLTLFTNNPVDIETQVYRLNSKESACALYRSITEHYAFYRCDSILPAVKDQVSKDFFDGILSWLPSDGQSEQNYIFDTERTCREAYDHARRTLFNFYSHSTAMFMDKTTDKIDTLRNDKEEDREAEALKNEVSQLKSQVEQWKEAFHCTICRDHVIDTVLQCGHQICFDCSELWNLCPLCRSPISSKTKFYLPIDIEGNTDEDLIKCSRGQQENDSFITMMD